MHSEKFEIAHDHVHRFVLENEFVPCNTGKVDGVEMIRGGDSVAHEVACIHRCRSVTAFESVRFSGQAL